MKKAKSELVNWKKFKGPDWAALLSEQPQFAVKKQKMKGTIA